MPELLDGYTGYTDITPGSRQGLPQRLEGVFRPFFDRGSLPVVFGGIALATAVQGGLELEHNSSHCHHNKRPPVHPIPAQRFNTELLPRIAEGVQALSHGMLHADILPSASPDQPARLRIWAAARAGGGRYAHPIDITLSWDSYEVDRLLSSGGVLRFAEYLDALPGKLDAWQEARQIDFSSRTQADPTVLIGGLDFEHLLR